MWRPDRARRRHMRWDLAQSHSRVRSLGSPLLGMTGYPLKSRSALPVSLPGLPGQPLIYTDIQKYLKTQHSKPARPHVRGDPPTKPPEEPPAHYHPRISFATGPPAAKMSIWRNKFSAAGGRFLDSGPEPGGKPPPATPSEHFGQGMDETQSQHKGEQR